MRFREFFYAEAKQDIANLGLPPLMVRIFQERFGNLAFLMARWYKESKLYGRDEPDWFRTTTRRLVGSQPDLWSLNYLYDATTDSETYKKALEFLDLAVEEEFYDDYYLQDMRKGLREDIEELLNKEIFFSWYRLPTAIMKGEVKDLGPYRKLNFYDAEKKYDERKMFREATPLKTYPNGWKWINVGKRCYLMGKLMKNCGSTGVMSLDQDKTMLGLFDPLNKPHVVVTYSPNEKRISGDEGQDSTAVKPDYHDYVLDLANFLGVRFDSAKSKSTSLKVKYLLRQMSNDVQPVESNPPFDEYFTFTVNGRRYYTNGGTVISEDDVNKLRNYSFKYNSGSLLRNVFNHNNTQNMGPEAPPITRTAIEQFVGQAAYT